MWLNKYAKNLFLFSAHFSVYKLMCVGTQNTIYELLIHLYCLFIMQCLQALEKISHEQPLACLQSGAIMAVLAYIEFFSTSVQVMYNAVWFKFRNSVHSDSI